MKTPEDQAYEIGKRERDLQGPRDEPLSGEWAGDYNVADLLNEIGVEDPDTDFSAILDSYEDGYSVRDAAEESAREGEDGC